MSKVMQIYVKDLLTRQNIKAKTAEITWQNIRSLEDSSNENPILIELDSDTIVDLKNNAQNLDLDNLICFYSHTEVALAKSAVELGIKNLHIRSKLFSNINEMLGAH